MDTGSYDTSRLFPSDEGPNCGYSCPRCDCGEYNYNDTWYVEYRDYYDFQYDEASCMKCTCKQDSWYGNPLNNYTYVDCDSSDSYDIGTATCDPVTGIDYTSIPGTTNDNVYYCHNQYNTRNGMLFAPPSTPFLEI